MTNTVQVQSLLSARRSYEFAVDDVKLTLLCLTSVLDAIRSKFQFAGTEIASPPSHFGMVLPSNPPGVVLSFGITPFPEGSGTVVRNILIDSRRVVIDVAGPSEVLDPTFDLLKETVSGLLSAEGASPLGEVQRTMDYSEIVIKDPRILQVLFSPAALEILRQTDTSNPADVIIPSARFRIARTGAEYPGTIEDHLNIHFDYRAGSKIEDELIFCGAPMDSGQLVSLVERLLLTL
jgi:hypothetical protein